MYIYRFYKILHEPKNFKNSLQYGSYFDKYVIIYSLVIPTKTFKIQIFPLSTIDVKNNKKIK